MFLIKLLGKDIEDVLNADIEYRFNELNPNEQRAFKKEKGTICLFDNDYQNNNDSNQSEGDNYNSNLKKFMKKKSIAIKPIKIHEEIEIFVDSINKEIKDKNNVLRENTQIKDNEYHGIETEDKRHPFGSFEFPK